MLYFAIYYPESQDEFWVNDGFSSKLTRIKVQMVSGRNETEPERKETRSKVGKLKNYRRKKIGYIMINGCRKTIPTYYFRRGDTNNF